MKRILLLFPCLLIFLVVNAGTIQKGYHGFAEAGYCYCTSQLSPTIIDVTTSHGYQFSPYIFLGAGVGFDYTGEAKWEEVNGHPFEKRDASVDIPVFFNGRLNFTKTKVIPFLDVKAGTYINNEGGYYLNAMLGCRLAISDNKGLSLAVGVKGRKITSKSLHIETGNRYNNYKTTYFYKDNEDRSLEGVVFKIGFDF